MTQMVLLEFGLQKGIKTFDPLDIPFFEHINFIDVRNNMHWAHHAVREGHRDQAIQALWLTVVLGVCFTLLQAFEYYEAVHHYLNLLMEFILQFFTWQLAFMVFM